jgi:hypothetical protein
MLAAWEQELVRQGASCAQRFNPGPTSAEMADALDGKVRVRLGDGRVNPKWSWLRDHRSALHLRFLHSDTTGKTYPPPCAPLTLVADPGRGSA